jgi:hypothetical protein
MWRHGDVLIAAVSRLPEGARKMGGNVLVRGEITGHSHRIKDPQTAEIWARGTLLFLRIVAPSATLVHEEHEAITLQKGIYKVWQQREYMPQAIRRIVD